MVRYITYIWQMGAGTGIFRFYTEDPWIARKLRRTNGWISILTECNRPKWIFQKTFNTPQDARKKLRSLCKVSKLEKGSDTGEFYAITYANKTLNDWYGMNKWAGNKVTNRIDNLSPRAGFYYKAEWRLSKAYKDLAPAARDLLYSLLCELRYSKKRKNGIREYINNGDLSFSEAQFRQRFNTSSETYIRARNQLIKNGLIKQTHRGGYGKGDRSKYKVLVVEPLLFNEQRWHRYPQENWANEIPKMKINHVGKKTRFKKGESGRELKSTLNNQGLKVSNNPNKSNPKK